MPDKAKHPHPDTPVPHGHPVTTADEPDPPPPPSDPPEGPGGNEGGDGG